MTERGTQRQTVAEGKADRGKDRERERDRDRDTQTETETDTETAKEMKRQTETDRETGRDRKRQTKAVRQQPCQIKKTPPSTHATKEVTALDDQPFCSVLSNIMRQE